MNNIHNVTYLIGSGLSVPFGLPNVRELTEFILSNNNVFRHTDQRFYVDGRLRKNSYRHYHSKTPSLIRLFLKVIKKRIKDHYDHLGVEREVNYEDIYDYILQVYNALRFEYENPAIDDWLLKRILKYDNHDLYYKLWDDLLRMSLVYIADILIYKLNLPIPFPVHYYPQLKSLLLIDRPEIMKNIFTLNHDTIIEHYLHENGIPFNDGFTFKVKTPKYNIVNMYKTKCNINLIKLHGSLNYYQQGWKLIKSWDRNYTENGEPVHSSTGSAYLTIGTLTKLIAYNEYPFEQFSTYFNYKLATNTKILLIIGYGLKDKGINHSLINWFVRSPENRLVIFHPNPKNLISNARGAIKREIMNRENLYSKKVLIINKGFEDIDDNIFEAELNQYI